MMKFIKIGIFKLFRKKFIQKKNFLEISLDKKKLSKLFRINLLTIINYY